MGATASISKPALLGYTNPLTDFHAIANNFKTYSELQQGLKKAGLESSELIIGVDFTKSNIYNGAETFGGRSLHYISDNGEKNPYQQVLECICLTLEGFDDDHLIPCYGFGDATSRAHKVFCFRENDEPCEGLDNVLLRYNYLAQNANLSGPTSFAPIIRKSINIIRQHDYTYHILLIIADGQVTPNELQETKDAIVEASRFPLSIVMVGVGDGPWDMMQSFDDELPARKYDNFQFVCFNAAIKEAIAANADPSLGFALQALMEIPEQYQIIQALKLTDIEIGEKAYHQIRVKDIPTDPPPPRRRQSLSLTPSQSFRSMSSGGELGSHPPSPATPSASLTSARSFTRRPSHSITEGEPPEDFVCPITHQMMIDPVIAQDGHSYERNAIVQWVVQHKTSPMTNQSLTSCVTYPNYNLRSQIAAWRAANPNYVDEPALV